MDKQQFKKFIEEVAVIEDLKPKKDPNIRLDDNAEDVVRVGDDWVEVTAKCNPTLGFKFIKLKDKHRACDLGCGDIISNQIIEKRLATHPEKHWRTRCATCGCFVSPDGIGFIEGGHNIQAAYMRWFRDGKVTAEPKVIVKGNSEITINERSQPNKWITDSEGNIRLNEDL